MALRAYDGHHINGEKANNLSIRLWD